MFGRLKRLWKAVPRLPDSWPAVQPFTVVVPLRGLDLEAAEAGLQVAMRIRAALTRLCRSIHPDAAFQRLDEKRRRGAVLPANEQLYVTQADRITLKMVNEKMHVALFYTGDFFALSGPDRVALCKLAERHGGCSLVSDVQRLDERRTYTVRPGHRITDAEADNLVLQLTG